MEWNSQKSTMAIPSFPRVCQECNTTDGIVYTFGAHKFAPFLTGFVLLNL